MNNSGKRNLIDLAPLLLYTGLLTLVILAAGAGSQFQIRFPQIPANWFAFNMEQSFEEPPGESVTGPELPPEVVGQTQVAIWPRIVLAALVFAVFAYFAYRYYQKRRGGWRKLEATPEPNPTEDVLIEQFETTDLISAVELAQRRMAEARSPSDAVVAGWIAFEEAAGTRGWIREPQETTTEFTVRLLARSPAPAAPVATLQELYQKVRFGGRQPSDDDVAAAYGALIEIAENIERIPDAASLQSGRSSVSNPTSLAPTSAIGVTRNKWGED